MRKGTISENETSTSSFNIYVGSLKCTMIMTMEN